MSIIDRQAGPSKTASFRQNLREIPAQAKQAQEYPGYSGDWNPHSRVQSRTPNGIRESRPRSGKEAVSQFEKDVISDKRHEAKREIRNPGKRRLFVNFWIPDRALLHRACPG